MVAMMGFRQGRESVVNRMGRSQPRAFEAEPAKQRVRLDDPFDRLGHYPFFYSQFRQRTVFEQRIVAKPGQRQ